MKTGLTKLLASVIVASLLLCSCASESDLSDLSKEDSSETESINTRDLNRKEVKYYIIGWKNYESQGKNNSDIYRVRDNIVYDLGSRVRGEGEENVLVAYDSGSMTAEEYNTLKDLKLQNEAIESFDFFEDGFVFLTKSHSLVFSETGKEIDIDKIIEDDISQIYTDDEYIYEVYSSAIVVWDKEGSKVNEYYCKEENYVLKPLKLKDGSLGFPILSLDTKEISFVKGKDFKDLEWGRMPAEKVFFMLAFIDNKVLYQDNKNVYSWDVTTGTENQIVSLGEMDVTMMDTLIPLAGEGTDIIIHCKKGGENFDVMLSETPVETEKTLDIKVFDNHDAQLLGYIQSSVTTFCHKNPAYSFMVESINDGEFDMDKEIIELTDGDAPALMIVDSSGLEMLAKKGLLADLGKIISKDVMDCAIPSVIDLGVIDGTYYGMAPAVYSYTLIASRNYCDKESWTIEDIIKTCESEKTSEIFTYENSGMYPEQLIYCLAMIDLEGNGFYDPIEKKSKFEEKGFNRLLEIAKNYSAENNTGSGEEKVKEGDCMAIYCPIFSPFVYSEVSHNVGNGFAIGFPSEKGNLNTMMANLYLVVNKQYENDEGVKRLLEYIWSAQNQKRIDIEGMSVRKDVCDFCLDYDTNRNLYVWSVGNGSKYTLPSTNDIDSFKKEWTDYLLSTRAIKNDPHIFEIINDEIEDYFDGTKDALAVTRIIDSRVQLYLDENS